MNFLHEPVDLGYDDLIAVTKDSGRVYTDPNNNTYPSITTVLSILSEDAIKAWRAKVGEEEANRISKTASNRGTAVHDLLERYVNNESDFDKEVEPHIMQSFYDVKPVLDKCLTKVYAQEAGLYSERLGVAGRVDCVGEWNGIDSIIDYKTSKKLKKKEWIDSYFMQSTAYAIMWEERTGILINQIVVVIAVDNEEPQIFIEKRENWTEKLIQTIAEYKSRKNI
jgi:CRISPR/Cas system-associated exonuclease Cas4 (RecB family)